MKTGDWLVLAKDLPINGTEICYLGYECSILLDTMETQKHNEIYTTLIKLKELFREILSKYVIIPKTFLKQPFKDKDIPLITKFETDIKLWNKQLSDVEANLGKTKTIMTTFDFAKFTLISTYREKLATIFEVLYSTKSEWISKVNPPKSKLINLTRENIIERLNHLEDIATTIVDYSKIPGVKKGELLELSNLMSDLFDELIAIYFDDKATLLLNKYENFRLVINKDFEISTLDNDFLGLQSDFYSTKLISSRALINVKLMDFIRTYSDNLERVFSGDEIKRNLYGLTYEDVREFNRIFTKHALAASGIEKPLDDEKLGKKLSVEESI